MWFKLNLGRGGQWGLNQLRVIRGFQPRGVPVEWVWQMRWAAPIVMVFRPFRPWQSGDCIKRVQVGDLNHSEPARQSIQAGRRLEPFGEILDLTNLLFIFLIRIICWIKCIIFIHKNLTINN
jgi:hypothetical protein